VARSSPFSLPTSSSQFFYLIAQSASPQSITAKPSTFSTSDSPPFILYRLRLQSQKLKPQAMAASLTSADHNPPFTQPVCQNCQTSTTPLWRRDEAGSVLCNACGLFLKLHGRPRPISLKTDVIKSRNRVKTANQGAKKKVNQILYTDCSRR
jgi:GATA-binding protein